MPVPEIDSIQCMYDHYRHCSRIVLNTASGQLPYEEGFCSVHTRVYVTLSNANTTLFYQKKQQHFIHNENTSKTILLLTV